mmetsp:Transcript_72270/g.233859  ORF Transcript_72270/g.233859 Transcript_72270/m.233859 type:complete len:574 (-) Transcript_72270:161-1882(-)
MAQGRVFATLMLLALPAASLGVTSSLTFDAAAAKKRPVSKVIKLLQDMQKQLEKEAREDEDLYEKLACWCETNDKEKTKSISDAEAKLEQLTVKIEEHTAKSSKLVVEIDNLDSEVAKDQKSLDEATALRKQQLAEFNAEETETLESIASLKAAVSVLSKHQGGASLLQMPRTHLLGVAATLQHEMQKHADLLAGVISPSEKRRAAAFIQAPEDYFDKQGAPGTGGSSYAPQSGEIFGILTTMKDTFEENLANSQKEEAANQKAYEELKAAKEEEISAGQEQLESKKELRADTDEKNAQAKEDVTDTKEALGADEEFIMMLKEKCQMTDHEWEERKKTRQLEIKAVSKALSTLSGDDAHDVFTRTFNPALLQRESITNSARRDQVAKVLSTAAQKLHSPRLAELAYQVRLDAFTKVKKAIDEMIVNLLKEKEEEIKLKAFCVEEFNKNEVQTARKERKKQDLIDQIKALQAAIKKLEQEIDTLKSEIAEMKSQMKKASEDREEENKEHKMTVSDQRETQRLLKAALSVLEDFYGKKAAMLQQQQRRDERMIDSQKAEIDSLQREIAELKAKKQ